MTPAIPYRELLTSPFKNLTLFPGDAPRGDPFFYEGLVREAGYHMIAGVDEAGRGPLAGPVVAAAVIMPPGIELPGVRDSKKMTPMAREEAFSRIQAQALAVGIGVVSHTYIDKYNILKAALTAMSRAVSVLTPPPDFLLVDGIHAIPVSLPQRPLKRGDDICLSISAASVMAKVYRDRIMCSYHKMYPQYDFENNKGYGTRRHLAALKQHGPAPIHRLSFKGVVL